MPQVGLVEKFTAFRREMELLAAAEIEDWESIAPYKARAYLDKLSQYDSSCGRGHRF